MNVISRKEAKAAGLKRYFTGKPCKRGHVVERQVASERCRECATASTAACRKRSPDKAAAFAAVWRKRNPGKAAALRTAWKKRNPDKMAAFTTAWRKRNPDKVAAFTATRRSAKLQRTPSWVDRDAIRAVFKEAKRLTTETGVRHDVDHEIPLQGKLVSGLHVHTNLRAIPAVENNRKYNKFQVAA